MFSGIIDAVGEIVAAEDHPGGRRLTVRAAGYWGDCRAGDSIAVDGVCLTLTGVNNDDAAFDMVAETLRCTTLGELKPGDAVNLHKSLRVGDRIDGHFVQGHVDAVAVVDQVEQTAKESIWWFRPPAEAMPCMVPKGSVAIDGISLTIAAVEDQRFSVAIIPTTLQMTTIGRKKPGDRVNVETDILARTVLHQLRMCGVVAGERAFPARRDRG